MAENDGLIIDKESHPEVLMLTEQLVTCSRILLIQSSNSLWEMTALV
jgi:hypothetical protein